MTTPPSLDQVERILDKLVKDTMSAMHAMYMGDVRGNTQRARTEVGRNEARQALIELLGIPSTRPSTTLPAAGAAVSSGAGRAVGGGMASGAGPAVGGASAAGALSQAEIDALRKCINAWLPMGAPSSATPDSRCIAAGRELVPTWGERELASAAVKKVT